MAATPKMGIPTAVMIKPVMAGTGSFLQAVQGVPGRSDFRHQRTCRKVWQLPEGADGVKVSFYS